MHGDWNVGLGYEGLINSTDGAGSLGFGGLFLHLQNGKRDHASPTGLF